MEGQLVRENSRVLSQAPDEKAVLVEFLDFECEACSAAYPFIEELRAEYSQTVTFVQRYFPLPGHMNSMNAAVRQPFWAAQRWFAVHSPTPACETHTATMLCA